MQHSERLSQQQQFMSAYPPTTDIHIGKSDVALLMSAFRPKADVKQAVD